MANLLINNDDVIYVAGHNGLAGSAVWRVLEAQGYTKLVGRRSKEVDLTDRAATFGVFQEVEPTVVVLAAARVGGILANDRYPVEFISDNLRIQDNVMAAAHSINVRRLLFLGSSCIYPKFAEQPIREESLLNGDLEPTNSAYAIAKIAGIETVDSYRKQHGRSWISAMPTNLYGPGDNFHPQNSHVLPAMIRRFHEAKQSGIEAVEIWGTGTPRREFLHSDDLGGALVHLLEHYDEKGPINVGCGEDISIQSLAETVARVVGYEGQIRNDPSKPDGTPRKLLDVSRLRNSGWEPKISIEEGISNAYQWFLNNAEHV